MFIEKGSNNHLIFHRPLIIIFLSMLFGLNTLTTAESSVGYHGAPFLKISPAARQVGMGEAFTALSNDINLMRYNVGGLGGITRPSLAMNFNTWIDDTQQGNIAFALPLPKIGVFGIDLTYFDEGQITQVDQYFNPIGGNGISGDVMISLGYGRFFKFGDYELGFGVGGKYLNQSLVGETSSVFALDAGLQFRFPKWVAFGASLQNIGMSKMQFDAWKSPLPETYQVGAALILPMTSDKLTQFILSSDAAWTRKEAIRYKIGGEFLLNDVFAVRSGYKFNDASISNWAAGFGLNMPATWLARARIRFDYAYAPLPVFDEAAHRFSLYFAFGSFSKDEVLGAQAYMESGITPEEAANMRDLQSQMEQQLKDAEEANQRLKLAAEELEAMKRDLAEKLAIINGIIGEDPGKMRMAYRKDETTGLTTGGVLTVFFDFDQASIRPSERQTMERVGRILKTFPAPIVQLSGHTDWIGDEDYNINLSQRRLDSVMVYLSIKEKVNPSCFFLPVGYGESKPIADNSTDDGRQQNRRVEFDIYFNEQEPEIPEGTAIRNVRMIDENTVQIEANGHIPIGKQMTLANPDRFVIDFNNIFLLSEDRDIQLNRGPFIKARLGFHKSDVDKFTRLVLDTQYSIRADVSSNRNFIVVKLRPALENTFEKRN
ncbi:MAG: PorV/PorQ family protein [Calditrichaeota bacterium]|nr:MAG: PorV/PorQ family protein [Calditrichota bacterium]